jgi:hypothetical protein
VIAFTGAVGSPGGCGWNWWLPVRRGGVSPAWGGKTAMVRLLGADLPRTVRRYFAFSAFTASAMAALI